MKMLLLSVAVAFLLNIDQSLSLSVKPEVTLYSNQYCLGQSSPLISNYIPNLSSVSFANKAKSAHITGVWIFYENANYNAQADGKVEFIFGPNKWCGNLNYGITGSAKSVRFAGYPQDYKANTLTLFKGKYFQGEDEYTFVDLPNLNLDKKASSLIITGASAWTLYALPNYQGAAVCVFPPPSNNFVPAFIYDSNIVGIPNQTIRSVKLGCFSTNTRTPFSMYSGYN